MGRTNFENLEVYKLAEDLSDLIWNIASQWNHLAVDTVGKQLIRAADSVGANIAEGAGRGTYLDNRRFGCIARGSLYETKHWLRRAYNRGLLTNDQISELRPFIDELAPRLNAYLKAIRNSARTNKK